MTKRFGFGKKEKLKSRKQIDLLFAQGKSFAVFPLRVTYQFGPAGDGPLLQAGVTASKKYYKKAVERNRIKRLLREAYRLQKQPLLDLLQSRQQKGSIFFIYTDKTISSFDVISRSMAACLKRLEKKIGAHEDPA